MQTVRISRKAAAAILKELETTFRNARVRQELESALRVSPKKKAQRRAARAKVEGKRATKREETSAIYEAVEARAGGLCEACGAAFSEIDPPEMDHQLGRGKVRQSAENCWLIHRSCHRARHANSPSAVFWWMKIAEHAWYWRHAETERKADDNLATAETKEQLAQSISMREAGK